MKKEIPKYLISEFSIYKLGEDFRTYEEFAIAKEWDKFAIKLWQLEQKLRLL